MFHRNVFRPPGLLPLLCVILAAPLWAGTVQYGDRSSWEAATSGITTIDFEGITDSWVSYSDANGLTIGDVQFVGVSTSNYELYVRNPDTGGGDDFESGSILKGPTYWSGDPNRHILVNLPAGVTSFGVDLMTLYSDPAAFNILLSTGDQFLNIATATRPTRRFFGLTSDNEITQLQFVLTGAASSVSYPGLDNFTYGTAGAGTGPDSGETPETATLILVGTGLIFLYRLRRKRLPLPSTS